MDATAELWRTTDKQRFFIVPHGATLRPGSLQLHDESGVVHSVDGVDVEMFEISEAQAHAWTKDRLGATLTELRQGIDEKLSEWRARLREETITPVAPDTSLTPNALPALAAMLRALPRIVVDGVSGEADRVAAARAALAELQRKLAAGGIDVDERFTNFADRLAGLRRDAAERADTSSAPSDQSAEERSSDASATSDPGSSR
jgi:hypothetical protein